MTEKGKKGQWSRQKKNTKKRPVKNRVIGSNEDNGLMTIAFSSATWTLIHALKKRWESSIARITRDFLAPYTWTFRKYAEELEKEDCRVATLELRVTVDVRTGEVLLNEGQAYDKEGRFL